MSSRGQILSILGLLALATQPAFAEDNTGADPTKQSKPRIEVSEKFWPLQSYKHWIYLSHSFSPILPERRWIAYADGQQITEIEFYAILGLDKEVHHLQKRRSVGQAMVGSGWALTTAGLLGLIQGGFFLVEEYRDDERSINTRLLGTAGLITGMLTVSVGQRKLYFNRTKRIDAYRMAKTHNDGL